MRNGLFPFLVFVCVLSVAPNAQARHDRECSEASLNGNYGWMLNGTIFGRGFIGGIGVYSFDGNGNLSTHGTVAFEDTGLGHPNFTGTYTVKPDCTGSLNHPMGLPHEIVIIDGGKEILEIAAESDRVMTWVSKKQGLEECTEASLNGSYGLIGHGTNVARGLEVAVGVITFDGSGHWSLAVTEVHLDTDVEHITNPNGTYTVNPDCTGSLELPTQIGLGTWDFVIADGGNEILQIATTADPIRVVTSVLRKQFHRDHDHNQD